jgi:hypothetical protein
VPPRFSARVDRPQIESGLRELRNSGSPSGPQTLRHSVTKAKNGQTSVLRHPDVCAEIVNSVRRSQHGFTDLGTSSRMSEH